MAARTPESRPDYPDPGGRQVAWEGGRPRPPLRASNSIRWSKFTANGGRGRPPSQAAQQEHVRRLSTRLRQDPPQRAKGCGEASHRVSVAAAYIFGGGLLLF